VVALAALAAVFFVGGMVLWAGWALEVFCGVCGAVLAWVAAGLRYEDRKPTTQVAKLVAGGRAAIDLGILSLICLYSTGSQSAFQAFLFTGLGALAAGLLVWDLVARRSAQGA
jgi:hypothetical protein